MYRTVDCSVEMLTSTYQEILDKKNKKYCDQIAGSFLLIDRR